MRVCVWGGVFKEEGKKESNKLCARYFNSFVREARIVVIRIWFPVKHTEPYTQPALDSFLNTHSCHLDTVSVSHTVFCLSASTRTYFYCTSLVDFLLALK